MVHGETNDFPMLHDWVKGSNLDHAGKLGDPENGSNRSNCGSKLYNLGPPELIVTRGTQHFMVLIQKYVKVWVLPFPCHLGPTATGQAPRVSGSHEHHLGTILSK